MHLSWQAPRICKYAIVHMHVCTRIKSEVYTHVFADTPGSGECLQGFSLYSREALQAFALRRVPRPGMGEGVEEPSTRISFRVSPSPQQSFFFFLHKSVQAGVSRRTGERGTWRFPERGSSPEPRDLHYLHPLIPRPGSSLSLRARAAGPNRTFLRLGARGLLLPSRPPPTPVRGPKRAPAVNSPGTPLGAGGRARSPPPDPAPPHPAQASASAAVESPRPPAQPESTPPSPSGAPSAAARAASLRGPQGPSRG